MSSDLSAILKKIQALRARAADAASTEAEAEMAARKAAELLAAHNINLSELDVRAEGVKRERWDSGKASQPVEMYAAHGIDALCNVKSWYRGGVVTVVGAPADVETALYFLDIVRAAVRSTWARYQKTGGFWRLRELGKSSREIGFAFRKGVATRLGQRMQAMAAEAKVVAPTDTGRAGALVPVKNSLIRQWMDDNRIKVRSQHMHVGDRSGFHAGVQAAENIGLHRGIGASRPSGLLA